MLPVEEFLCKFSADQHLDCKRVKALMLEVKLEEKRRQVLGIARFQT